MDCSIEFEKGVQKFYSGHEVNGTIKIDNDKHREILGIFLIIEGSSETHWTESEGSGDDQKSQSYGGKLQLIFNTIPLMQKGEEVLNLNPGKHIFNFNFTLHPNLPSSLSNFYGKIFYAVKIKIARVEKWKIDKMFNFPFDVVSFVDLNLEDIKWRQRMRVEISKQFLMSTKSLNLSAEISQQAFAPLQDVNISVSIENNTRVEVIAIIITLHRDFTFKSDFVSTKTYSELLIKNEQQGVKEKSLHQATYTFQIPENLIPSVDFSRTKYIQVVYKIEITAKVSGVHRSPRLYLPIFIGSVPLK